MASNNSHDARPSGTADLLSARRLIVVGLAIAASILSIRFADGPLFEFIAVRFGHYAINRFVLTSGAILAAGIGITILASLHKSRLRKILIVTLYSAICAVGTNDIILKKFFGRPVPDARYTADQALIFFRGAALDNFSFPSGHCALAVATITVLWRYYPRWWPLYLVCLFAACFMLLTGEWHFLSDLIAGALWGWVCALTSMHLLARVLEGAEH